MGVHVETGPRIEHSAAGSPDFGWSLTTLLRTYLRNADAVLEGLPGGARSYRLLVTVARDNPPSQLALAERVGLDRTVVTYLLDDLVRSGLVERQMDPHDRRHRRVILTSRGAEQLRVYEARLRQVEQHVLGGLEPTDAELLSRLLSRAAQATGAADRATCADVDQLGGSR